ncbi:MAG: hypothetical protein NTY61_01620 [Candidatus Parcubacteria bacterium]|nr:hypothetical protein [Candidatus Parcubacteria bacterium]
MTYKVIVVSFASDWLNTFAEAWDFLNREFGSLPKTAKAQLLKLEGFCWIRLGDGRVIELDSAQDIARALGLIGEGKGFAFQTVVSADQAQALEPRAQELIELWAVHKTLTQEVALRLDQLRQGINELPIPWSPKEAGEMADYLRGVRLQVEKMHAEYEKAMGR